MDVQVFEADALREIEATVTDADAREHVSMPFYRPKNAARWQPRFVSFFPDSLCRRVWLSLDYAEDYQLIGAIYDELSGDPGFGAEAMIDACERRPDATRACLNLRGW